ncbi:MAG: ATP-binding protein [Pirellulaceae bacterium]
MKNASVDKWRHAARQFGWKYGVATLTTIAAIWVRTLLNPFLEDRCPFSLFYLSVLTTAWIAGTGPAIFAIALGTLAAAHYFVEPASSLMIHRMPDQVHLAIYVIVNLVATTLFNRLERQRHLAETRSADNERLSQSLREADMRKDEFLALLAHELRNPLAPIRSSLALLDRKSDSPETVRRLREVMQRQTNHLIRITDDLLDVSRFCRGRVELRLELMDLRDAVEDAVEMVEAIVQEKSHRLQLLVPDHPVTVNGDRVRLTQLTANLLSNAAKYTPHCGRITLQMEVIDASVVLSVIDNGIGFSASQAERILEPFVQVDTSRTREYGGLGVGLTIVDRLVSLHGGELTIFSRGPGLGSQFTVSLPTVITDVREASAKVPQDKVAESSRNASTEIRTSEQSAYLTQPIAPGRRLLVVEDNMDASGLLAELFESEGYSVQVACDGIEALQLVKVQSPDIVIMDIGLPGMDGYEIAKRIRRDERSHRIALIALTGWGSDADRELAIQAGFDLHLIKPVVFRELLQHVQELVGRKLQPIHQVATDCSVLC